MSSIASPSLPTYALSENSIYIVFWDQESSLLHEGLVIGADSPSVCQTYHCTGNPARGIKSWKYVSDPRYDINGDGRLKYLFHIGTSSSYSVSTLAQSARRSLSLEIS